MFSTFELASAIGAQHHGKDVVVQHVLMDTRTLKADSLFVALRGERYDGHDYVATAFRHGAVAALVAESANLACGRDASLLVVPDTKKALVKMATWWRQLHSPVVVAIVGSNGKTTTKEMIASILRAQFGVDHVLATPGNWNNEIGVPLTVLMLRKKHRAAVVEIGMNHSGETAMLAAIAAPGAGLINNAQREHQLFMRSVLDVAKEHGALIAALPRDGVVILNSDDPFVGYWRDLARGLRTREFGLSQSAAVTGSYNLDAGGIVLDIRIDGNESFQTRVNIVGEHSARNALAAVAVANAIGVGEDSIVKGLASFQPAKGRLQLKTGRSGALVIDDSYNANPDSMRAAIDVLAASDGKLKVLIIGDMDEVGERSPQFHAEIGFYARDRGIDRLLAIGVASLEAARAFGDQGQHFENPDSLVEATRAIANKDTAVLVKGSRFMRMESIVERLVNAT